MDATLQMTCETAASIIGGNEKPATGVAKNPIGNAGPHRVEADALPDADAFHCGRSARTLPLMPHSCCRRSVLPDSTLHLPSCHEKRAIS